jgi:hypothetical protein
VLDELDGLLLQAAAAIAVTMRRAAPTVYRALSRTLRMARSVAARWGPLIVGRPSRQRNASAHKSSRWLKSRSFISGRDRPGGGTAGPRRHWGLPGDPRRGAIWCHMLFRGMNQANETCGAEYRVGRQSLPRIIAGALDRLWPCSLRSSDLPDARGRPGTDNRSIRSARVNRGLTRGDE